MSVSRQRYTEHATEIFKDKVEDNLKTENKKEREKNNNLQNTTRKTET